MDRSTESLIGVPERTVLGVRVHAATMRQALDICLRAVELRRRLVVGVVNGAKVVSMHRQSALKSAVDATDVTFADGMSVVWASRLLRQPLPERVAGIDLFQNLLRLADEKALSVFLLGAEQEVLDKVVARIRAEHPRARLVGARNGYFGETESGAVADQVRAAHPDLLFVAITSPKKEIFLSRWSDHMQIAVCHGVGGSFDVLAGKVKRAPRLWQRLGIEWLYRVVQEPRRMWKRYAVTNTIFIWMLLKALPGAWLGRKSSATEKPAGPAGAATAPSPKELVGQESGR
jgi:N-acetylglucosaminyldiphosphoundecaprenol N-acetyl-beta-D-mannosaminyltransferase